MPRMVEKTCAVCGSKFLVPHWRENTAKYCSRDCEGKAHRAKANVECTYCHKKFHMKKYRLERYGRHMGVFCSRECETKYRSLWFRGSNNHQYGLKGDKNASFKGNVLYRENNNLIEKLVYAPYRVDSDKDGRVTEHRLLVETNWWLFDANVFGVIDGQHVLKDNYNVHHIDGNHNNNELSNLSVVTRSEHTSIHNKEKKIIRDAKGRIVTVINSDRGEGGYGSTGR